MSLSKSRFTDEQCRAIDVAVAGHNLFLSGQAGTGKSFVVNGLVKSLRAIGKNVAVICSSGISCSVYGDGVVSCTVHSAYALQTADMPSEMVITRTISLPHIVKRLKAVHTIIWDEAGMSSKRIFQLINAIHSQIAEKADKNKPFGSKQIILVGEFLQLKPVPSSFDDGEFMFRSRLFTESIPHRFELTGLMRQNSVDDIFIRSLRQLRLGECGTETEAFLKSLDRPVQGEDTVHIYFTKLAVMVHNQESLFQMPGCLYTFKCIDEGKVTGISCPAEENLLLKVGAKVKIAWNLSDQVKNGTAGTFIGQKGDKLEVRIKNYGNLFLKRQTWSNRDRSGKVIGSRTQFPVTLFYACTSHKTQGLTLASAVLHCSKEFVSGLTYVAVSRVRHPDHLQVCGFKHTHLLKPSTDVLSACESNEGHLDDDLSCCRVRNLPRELFSVSDFGEEFGEEDRDAPEVLPVDLYPDGLVTSYFERENEDEVCVDLGTIFLTLEDRENGFSEPPEQFDIVALVKNQKVPETNSDNQFCQEKNAAISKLLTDNAPQLRLFSLIQWFKIFCLMGDHLALNEDEVLSNGTMVRKHLTDLTHYLYLGIIGSVQYRRELRALFEAEHLSEAQLSIGSQLCIDMFNFFIQHMASKLNRQHATEQVCFNVSDMPSEGLARLRHVGGWAVRKELECYRRYVRENIYSQSTETRQKVYTAYAKCKLLDEHVIVQFSWLRDNTSAPDTLEVTEDRQYRERGLLHISDAAFECFKLLETIRVQHLNVSRVTESIEKETVVDDVIKIMQISAPLLSTWKACFTDAEKDKEVLVEELFRGVVKRYTKMAACQFLKDFRRAYQLKKTTEHRKRVLQRKQVATQSKEHVTFASIEADRSAGKQISHCRLKNYIHKHGVAGIKQVYLKEQLGRLAQAYGVTIRSSFNKQQLAQTLSEAVSKQENVKMPFPHYMDNLRSTTVENDGRVVLRITRLA